jgi:hypothetical protein
MDGVDNTSLQRHWHGEAVEASITRTRRIAAGASATDWQVRQSRLPSREPPELQARHADSIQHFNLRCLIQLNRRLIVRKKLSCLAYFPTPKMAKYSSETSRSFRPTAASASWAFLTSALRVAGLLEHSFQCVGTGYNPSPAPWFKSQSSHKYMYISFRVCAHAAYCQYAALRQADPHPPFRTLIQTVWKIQSSEREPGDYNFACGSVWVRNLVSDIKGGA